MILLRQEDNLYNIKDQLNINFNQGALGSINNCIHQKDIKNMCIYPCCFEICCGKCPKTPLFKDGHSCASQRENSNTISTIPVSFSKFLENQSKIQNKVYDNGKIHNSNVILCSVCQKSSNLYQNINFFSCKNCDKQFCQKCQSVVHQKGKFMSHQVSIIQRMKNNMTFQSVLKCQIHNKVRNCMLKNKIVCQICFNQETGKHFIFGDTNTLDFSTSLENIKFSQEYLNEIYHNEGNRISQTKQALTRTYQQMMERIQQRYRWNLNQLQRTELNLKDFYTKNIGQLSKFQQQVEILGLYQDKLSELLSKDILVYRMQLIGQKLYQVQNQCEQLMTEMNFQYKVGDREKFQSNIQQFLKCLNVTKIKRTEDQSFCINRSMLRNQLKTSRTTSRPSSNRLTNSKDNRCLSSFKKNDFSSNKPNSSFKEKGNFNKNDSNKKCDDTPASGSSMKKSTINRSLSNRIPASKENYQGSKSNLNFFKDKQINLKDIKDLEKAEYQDLNLNLKKLIASRKPTQLVNNLYHINKVSQRPSQNTSLQKKSIETENALQKQFLTKQNQKSTINSGTFLKMFQTSKSKVSARKNYLLSSTEDLSEHQSGNKHHKSRIEIKTSNMKNLSPQKHSQLKNRNIKHQLFGSNPSSAQNFSEVETYSKFLQSSSPPQKSSKNKQNQLTQQSKKSQQNPSLLFDKLIAVSSQKPNSQPQSQLSSKLIDESSLEIDKKTEMFRSQISEFSTVLTVQSEYKNTSQMIRNVQMISSIQVGEFNTKQESQIKKTKVRGPSTSKVLQNKEVNQNRCASIRGSVQESKSVNPSQILKDTSNNLRDTKKVNHEKISINVQNEKGKKKPDFMDMRQKMRKPNYLSTRFGSNLSSVLSNVKTGDVKK